jgi:glycerol-3-phosphate O-acyltransferase / dihydroxyacetone phosphate acyltransferase
MAPSSARIDYSTTLAAVPNRRRLDGFVERLARLLASLFFRSVEVEGREHIPRGVPLVVVANHHNSLVDPLLVFATLGVRPRFLAKSTLWDVPGIRQLLDLAGAVPVYRRQDEGVDTTKNDETFTRCFDELAAGGSIALFPEGISHDAPALAPLKTGAARIVLGAMRERGVTSLLVLPVGLTFDEKGIFRSRVLVRVGEPIDPGAWQRADEHDPREATRSLTAAIGRALTRVTLNYPSHEEASLLEQASDVFAARERELPARMALAEAFALRRAAIASYERLLARDPQRALAVRARLADYAARIEALGLRDEHVAARYPREEVLAYSVGSAALLFWWLPLAALGTFFNWIPYRLVGLAAGRAKSRDLPATVKLFGGFFVFPITWVVWAVLAGMAFGAGAAFGVLFLAPATGWYAMRFQERYERFFDDAVAYLRVKWRRRRVAELKSERDALHTEVSALVKQGAEPDEKEDP